jgi:hypothetical protein
VEAGSWAVACHPLGAAVKRAKTTVAGTVALEAQQGGVHGRRIVESQSAKQQPVALLTGVGSLLVGSVRREMSGSSTWGASEAAGVVGWR